MIREHLSVMPNKGLKKGLKDDKQILQSFIFAENFQLIEKWKKTAKS
jgi:hypothetical protein